MTTSNRTVEIKPNVETTAWRLMRLSGILLIPLAWGHVLLQDVLVGVHKIDLDYVVLRWSTLGWQAYDILLLAFALAHGMNGLRQVLNDFVQDEKAQKAWARVLFVLWLVVSVIGGIAIVASAAKHLAG